MTAVEPVDPAARTDGRSLRRERNAELLFDAANELLASRSFDELNVDDICEHAGVGRATFFRIFDTKAGLLREFNRRLACDASERLDAAGDVDIRTALEHIRAAIIDAWRDARPGHVGMASEFMRSLPAGSPHAAHPELLALVVERITAAMDSGELPDTVPPDVAASLILLNLVTPVAHAIEGHNVDINHLSQVLLEQWIAGMTASTTRPRRRKP